MDVECTVDGSESGGDSPMMTVLDTLTEECSADFSEYSRALMDAQAPATRLPGTMGAHLVLLASTASIDSLHVAQRPSSGALRTCYISAACALNGCSVCAAIGSPM
jgi:hypothetical protein